MSTTINMNDAWVRVICQNETDDQKIVDLSLAFIEKVHAEFKGLEAINTFSDTRTVLFVDALVAKGVQGLVVDDNTIKFSHS